ncbi:hypothetical protein TEA_018178 [Camellia sinensis var. sinensis]|uniref:K Homology domain-containing protein n=1 Tax=Camellia sinensis var. sinensis TaxID=542762 RepID=A0A4S4D202_CAMSN|nr:hypothetical protein TEA_018178 [Camellia sinensis var. sinensis]
MDNKIPHGSYFQYSPTTGIHGSLHRSSSLPLDHERYLKELLAERQKLGPFIQVIPVCGRLLNQGIKSSISCLAAMNGVSYGFGYTFTVCAVSDKTKNNYSIILVTCSLKILKGGFFVWNGKFSMMSFSLNGAIKFKHLLVGYPLEELALCGVAMYQSSNFYPDKGRSLGQQANGGPMDLDRWSAVHTQENELLKRITPSQGSHMGWHRAPGIPTTPIVKRVIRLDVPVDKFPNYNFVGRLLGPRGNSLKRVEAMTECRVYIRGQGSVKDSIKEEKLKDKPGYEHLNEPLHLLVEAEFPEDIVDSRLDHAIAILENLLKPVVRIGITLHPVATSTTFSVDF